MHSLLRAVALVFLVAVACACSPVTSKQDWIEPIDAINAANNDPVHGVRGKFIITVKGLDSYPQESFLNSERDYRDQRCLTIRIPTSLLPELEQRLGLAFADLRHRRLVVLGVARRQRIEFFRGNMPTGKYYYQTHVAVSSATQITLAD